MTLHAALATSGSVSAVLFHLPAHSHIFPSDQPIAIRAWPGMSSLLLTPVGVIFPYPLLVFRLRLGGGVHFLTSHLPDMSWEPAVDLPTSKPFRTLRCGSLPWPIGMVCHSWSMSFLWQNNGLLSVSVDDLLGLATAVTHPSHTSPPVVVENHCSHG